MLRSNRDMFFLSIYKCCVYVKGFFFSGLACSIRFVVVVGGGVIRLFQFNRIKMRNSFGARP